MNFFELDKLVRAALPDGVDRRNILEGLHALEEGMNLCANFYLSAAGYKIDEEGRLEKQNQTMQQVNSAILRGTK